MNWEALDALVIDFAKSENLFEDLSCSSPSSSPDTPSSSSYHSRLRIRQIRKFLEIGDIDAALDYLRAHVPSILEDHRLLFRLHKQKFIELLRRGTAKDRDCAIDCLRNGLAPCALDAYPEAYEEFKHVLLAFIYDKDDQTSPVAKEWSEKRRFEIAGLISSVLRAHLQAYDPVFSMTLRYLISIHKGFCFRQGVSSPISDLTERLLLEECDLPATPQEVLYEAPPFDEVDIQALAHAVELTRQGAIDGLRLAKGNLIQAFENELCRMRLDVSVLDSLVHEYCVYRGIIYSGFASPPALETYAQAEPGNCSSTNYSSEMDCEISKQSDSGTSITNADVGSSPEINAASRHSTDVEVRYPCDQSPNHENCGTSGAQHGKLSRILQGKNSCGIGRRSGRKRWRGRCDQLSFGNESCKQHFIAMEQQISKEHSAADFTSNREDKYELVLGMKNLASRGMAAEVVQEVNAIDPNFFVQNPALLFQLKQVEFLKLVDAGDHSTALRVACSDLGPLAASNSSLLKPLKETLLALLRPNEDALGKGLSLHGLATSLQVALGRRLGIEEPQLMKIIRAALHTHNEWFKLQMCEDRFEGLLKIDSLKESSTPLIGGGMSKSNSDTCTQGSSQVTVSSSGRMTEDGSSLTQVSTRDVCDENAILKVMEFLALPRVDAIHLLAQYNGNAETVIQQLFA